jgi:hypothetical protein
MKDELDGLTRQIIVLSYLRLYDRPLGWMLNFNVTWLADEGVHRFVHNFPDR